MLRRISKLRTNDMLITDLMKSVHSGKIQLPDFQRGWVWSDSMIKKLIASIIRKFPVGAAMFLEYGNSEIKFKYRPVEGAPTCNTIPSELILDGQQRLTSIYAALFSPDPVCTKNDNGTEIKRYYYINISKALDPSCDMADDAIISVPETKIITENIGRDIVLDLSSPEKEYKEKMFPLNIIFDAAKTMMWYFGYCAYHGQNPELRKEYESFAVQIITEVSQYRMPVIFLENDTPREAVCQVFENVNTGGVSLTVFELVTAIFAIDEFNLRADWEERKEKYFDDELLSAVSATDFLTACTLLTSYRKGGTVSCKKKDVLALRLTDYRQYADEMADGFKKAAHDILMEEKIFSDNDIPYTTQLIPLAVLCVLLKDGSTLSANIKNKLKQWLWCGVFGELYGSALDSRYVNDVVEVMAWIKDGAKPPRTVEESYFSPTRLLSVQTRNSAAYKGIMALILKNGSRDFISGSPMDIASYVKDKIDIHHIFPKDYCKKRGLPREKWNSAVNKTPIAYGTNRKIGSKAPSVYIRDIERTEQADTSALDEYLASHWIDASMLRTDNFDGFFIERAKNLLNAIETATGKPISGRDSDEVVKAFGAKLI